MGERIKRKPSQRELTAAVQLLWQKLGGLVVCLLVCLQANAVVTRDTEWRDVPPETLIKDVVDLSAGGGGGGGGVTPLQVTNIWNNLAGSKMVPQYDDNLSMTASETLFVSNILQVGETSENVYQYVGAMAHGFQVNGQDTFEGKTYEGMGILGPGVMYLSDSASANNSTITPGSVVVNGKDVVYGISTNGTDYLHGNVDISKLRMTEATVTNLVDKFMELHQVPRVNTEYDMLEISNAVVTSMMEFYDVGGMYEVILTTYGGMAMAGLDGNSEMEMNGNGAYFAVTDGSDQLDVHLSTTNLLFRNNNTDLMEIGTNYIKRTGEDIVYGVSTDGTTYEHGDVDLSTAFYPKTTGETDHTAVTNMAAYLGGQNVRVSVTNYYAASSGDLPRLRIEENISNNWTIVWDENDKFEGFRTNTLNGVAAMTNNLIGYVDSTKAPKAWGAYTSAGADAPPNTVWHTAGKTVFGGGTEFKCVTTANGIFGALCNVGGVVYGQGNPGTFRFETEDFRYFFGMRVEDSYMIGCNTDGITTTQVGGNTTVQLSYDIVMSGKPVLYYRPTLEHFASNHWEQLNDSSGTPIPGASLVANWDMSPPAGKEICYINCGTNKFAFFTAAVEMPGANSFETNLEADFQAGILATNEVLHKKQAIEPYIDDAAGTVKWRVKP